jgi:NAD/NADP transhydrogenase alpha subunit
MWVNVAVLKETQGLERRVALVPSVAAGLIRLGVRLRRQLQHGLRRCPGRVGEDD